MNENVNLKYWPSYFKAPAVHSDRRKWLSNESKVFTMGSCFAVSVREALIQAGIGVYPNYVDVPYDSETQIFDKIPHERSMFAHYDTFVMRQEIEAAFGLWSGRSQGFFTLKTALSH